jgi:hypothetical protein
MQISKGSLNVNTNDLEGLLDKGADRVGLTSGKDIVFRVLSLEHQPHAIDIVSSMTPITLGINIAKVNTLLVTQENVGNSTRNFSSHKSRATTRALVVEEDTIASKHVVGFPVVLDNPVSVLLSNACSLKTI